MKRIPRKLKKKHKRNGFLPVITLGHLVLLKHNEIGSCFTSEDYEHDNDFNETDINLVNDILNNKNIKLEDIL